MESHRIQTYFFLALLVGIFVFTLYMFSPFLAPVALALMTAVILKPFAVRIMHFVRSRSFGALLTIILLAVVIIVPIGILAAEIFNESYELYTNVRDTGAGDVDAIIERVAAPIRSVFPGFNIDVEAYVGALAEWIFNNTGSFFTGTADVIFKLFLGAITLFYLLKDGPAIRKALVELSPLSDRYDVGIINRLEQAINSVIRGSLLVALVQGLLTGTGLAIFGIPHAVLWGSLAAVAALIPYVGTGAVLIPSVIYLFATDMTGQAIGLLIWGIIAVGTVDNLLMPIFVGKGFRAHPLLILFAVLGGLSFFGPVGLFLGPLIVALLLALIDIYKVLILDTAHKEQMALEERM